LFIKHVVCLLVSVVLVLGISFPATAGNTAIQMLTVSVQVLDKSFAHKAAVRSAPGIASVNPHTRVKETKIFAEYSIDHSLTIERGKNITITGKVENPLLDRDALFIQSTASGAMSQDNILLSTSEQDLMASTTEGAEGSSLNTYPFHYSLSTEDSALEEIQLTRPIIVVLTVYY
jgi:acetaldehyde dehydrogenase (acetylating)